MIAATPIVIMYRARCTIFQNWDKRELGTFSECKKTSKSAWHAGTNPPTPLKQQMSPSTCDGKNDSRLFKSGHPRKFVILDEEQWVPFIWNASIKFQSLTSYSIWPNFQCPLRKGIIYYIRHNLIIEHHLDSSSMHNVRLQTRHTDVELNDRYTFY